MSNIFDNPDVAQNPYTQRIGETDIKKFQQTPMMRVDHEDHSLHMIGDALPPPSESQNKLAGPFESGTNNLKTTGTVGKSPIPARADHRHDVSVLYSVYTRGSQYCPPGQTFISGFGWALGNRDLRIGGTQIFDIPLEGYWIINGVCENSRDGGGDFTGQMEMRLWFNNGVYSRAVWNQRIAGATTHPPQYWSFVDTTTWQKPYTSDKNVQISYSHNDSVGHYVQVNSLTLCRVGSLYT